MKSIRLIATHTAKPQQREALLAALEKNVRESRKEPGNVSFEVFEDITTPGIFYLIEDWRNKEAIEAHRESSHFKEYMQEAQNFLEQRTAVYASHVSMNDA